MFENVYCGFNLPKGWGPIVEKMCLMLEQAKLDHLIKVCQVKNKFGGLRVYYDSVKEVEPQRYRDVDKVIDLVCRLSFFVCPECATTADVALHVDRGYVYTLCTPCRNRPEMSPA
jgi:hypothetical protein